MHRAAQQTRLTRLGYRYVGPFVLDWYNRLTRKLAGNSQDFIHMLGREGWNLVPIFNTLEAVRGGTRRYLYLQTSRALLTHIGLSVPSIADFAFSSRYEGTVRAFVEGRMGLNCELAKVGVADQYIRLPMDREYVKGLLAAVQSRAAVLARASREAYQNYLTRSHFFHGTESIVVDLGFRGTSQALLSSIYDRPIHGYYAMLDPSGLSHPLTMDPAKTTGLFSDSFSFGDGYSPLDCSLLLEAVLTAPTGQVIGIQDRDWGNPFIYRSGKAAQKNFGVVAEIIQGAYMFVYDHTDLVGSNHDIIQDFPEFFESYRESILIDIDLIRPILDLDDSYFGTEVLSAEIKL